MNSSREVFVIAMVVKTCKLCVRDEEEGKEEVRRRGEARQRSAADLKLERDSEFGQIVVE